MKNDVGRRRRKAAGSHPTVGCEDTDALGVGYLCEEVGHLPFEGLKALFFELQLLLHAGQVALQLVHLNDDNNKPINYHQTSNV